MEHEDNKGVFKEAIEDLRDYVDAQIEYLKLSVAQSVTNVVSSLILWSVVGFLALFFINFASFTLALLIGNALGGLIYGMAIVAGLYALAIVLIFLLRKQLFLNPVVKAVAQSFFGNGKDNR